MLVGTVGPVYITDRQVGNVRPAFPAVKVWLLQHETCSLLQSVVQAGLSMAASASHPPHAHLHAEADSHFETH